MSDLLINGKKISIPGIIGGDPKYQNAPDSDFEIRIFDFIRKWHSKNALFRVPTSGSTGISRILEIDKKSMQDSAQLTAEALGLKSGMKALLVMDPKYIAGMMMIARTLAIEMDLVAVEPAADPFQSIPENVQIDFAAFVPLQINQMIHNDRSSRLDKLQKIIIGGGPVSKTLQKKIRHLQVPVYHTYGMTETLSHIALKRLNSKDSSDSYKVLPGIRIDTDSRGCLKVGGAFLRKEIITNDLVRIIDPTRFVWLGRYDNVINSGGIKLHPETLEQQISEILQEAGFGNVHFFLGGIPDDRLGEKMILFIENFSGLDINKKELLTLIKEKLQAYHCPGSIELLNNFEFTETGKLKRRLMLDKFLKGNLL